MKKMFSLLPFIMGPVRSWLLKYTRMQRALIVFFLSGFFVYMGVIIQEKLSFEIMKTLNVFC